MNKLFQLFRYNLDVIKFLDDYLSGRTKYIDDKNEEFLQAQINEAQIQIEREQALFDGILRHHEAKDFILDERINYWLKQRQFNMTENLQDWIKNYSAINTTNF